MRRPVAEQGGTELQPNAHAPSNDDAPAVPPRGDGRESHRGWRVRWRTSIRYLSSHFDRLIFKGPTGTHIYDVHLGLGDLIDVVGGMLAIHAAR